MSQPVVILDTSRIREGAIEEVKSGMTHLAGFVEANEPRALAYDVYLQGDTVTVLQVHPDSASAVLHMDLAADLFRPFAALLDLRGIDVYGGAPTEQLLSRLRRKASMLGGDRVIVHQFHAGFMRFVSAEPGTSV